MTESDIQSNNTPGLESPGAVATESKRLLARRRFLTNGAAAGVGTIIVTFHHKRASAAGKGIMTSSVVMPVRVQGLPGQAMQIADFKKH